MPRRWCLGGVLGVSWKCLEVFRRCLGCVSEVFRVCLGGVLQVSRRCLVCVSAPPAESARRACSRCNLPARRAPRCGAPRGRTGTRRGSGTRRLGKCSADSSETLRLSARYGPSGTLDTASAQAGDRGDTRVASRGRHRHVRLRLRLPQLGAGSIDVALRACCPRGRPGRLPPALRLEVSRRCLESVSEVSRRCPEPSDTAPRAPRRRPTGETRPAGPGRGQVSVR